MNAPLAKEQIALLMSDSLTYREAPVEGMEGAVAAPRPTFGDRVRGWMQAERPGTGRYRPEPRGCRPGVRPAVPRRLIGGGGWLRAGTVTNSGHCRLPGVYVRFG